MKCLVSKGMYSGSELNCDLKTIVGAKPNQNQNQKFAKPWFWTNFGSMVNIRYQKAFTQAWKLNGDLETIIGAKPKPNKEKPKTLIWPKIFISIHINIFTIINSISLT